MNRNIIYIFFLFLYSCSTNVTKVSGVDKVVVFPSPPSPARIQFLTSISNSVDITGKRSGFMEFVTGEKDEGDPITKPYGISIYKGVIYICDTILGGLEKIDLNNNTFEYFQPGGLGKLKKPINCTLDERGYLYVADSERKQIVVFEPDGNYLTCFGDPEIIKPGDVTVYKNKIWITDISNRCVRVYDKNNFSELFSIPGENPDSSALLYSPTNLTLFNDRVYVSDIGNFKVKVFTTDGRFIRSVGSFGRNLGNFTRPKGIAVDRDNNLYVVDAGFENVQIFNSKGELLLFFGGNYKGPGDMWLPAKVIVDYDNLEYFRDYVHKSFDLKYLIFVTNQYGPDKINVYGFVERKN